MQLTKLFSEFTNSQRASGLVLIACTVFSLLATNLFDGYSAFWQTEVAHHTITHWINDGLMTIFFLLIGLELEREIYHGELSTVRSALLPALAALGGMIIPAAIYFLINNGPSGNTDGMGIPMATDIAFALGVLSLLGSRVPAALKVFLTALAVIDDLGAILVIAIFYTGNLSWMYLAAAFGIWAVLFGLNRLKVNSAWPYIIGGVVMWYCMLNSGVHATITGVILAFVIPFGSGDERSLSYRLQHILHKPVTFLILPIFALANTCIHIDNSFYAGLVSLVSLGVIFGLVIGKPLGIFLFTLLTVKLRISSLPEGVNRKQILGAGFLGGIGFTMSIFISLLAFTDPSIIDQAKIAVLVASLIAGISGFAYLGVAIRKKPIV